MCNPWMFMMRQLILTGVAALLVSCAQQEPPVSEQAKASSEAPTATQAGQRAYIDPETGELTVPPAQERKAMDSDQDSSSPNYSFETRPDGVGVMRPKDPTRRKLEATKAEDGSVDYEEATDDD